jgi:hypothetical protein
VAPATRKRSDPITWIIGELAAETDRGLRGQIQADERRETAHLRAEDPAWTPQPQCCGCNAACFASNFPRSSQAPIYSSERERPGLNSNQRLRSSQCRISLPNRALCPPCCASALQLAAHNSRRRARPYQVCRGAYPRALLHPFQTHRGRHHHLLLRRDAHDPPDTRSSPSLRSPPRTRTCPRQLLSCTRLAPSLHSSSETLDRRTSASAQPLPPRKPPR